MPEEIFNSSIADVAINSNVRKELGKGSKPVCQLFRDLTETGRQPARGLAATARGLSACSVSRARTSHLEDATVAGDGGHVAWKAEAA